MLVLSDAGVSAERKAEYSQVFDISEASGVHTEVFVLISQPLSDAQVQTVISAIGNGGKLRIIGPGSETMQNKLQLQGFLDISLADGEISARKPDLSQGAAVRRPRRNVADILAASGADVKTVSDAELLKEEDLMKPSVEAVDCSPAALGKKKACKNCSCGLKEAEEEAEASGKVLETAAAKSACGNVSFDMLLTIFLICFFSVIWVMLLDVLPVRIVDCRLSNLASKFSCQLTCYKTIWIFKTL